MALAVGILAGTESELTLNPNKWWNAHGAEMDRQSREVWCSSAVKLEVNAGCVWINSRQEPSSSGHLRNCSASGTSLLVSVVTDENVWLVPYILPPPPSLLCRDLKILQNSLMSLRQQTTNNTTETDVALESD